MVRTGTVLVVATAYVGSTSSSYYVRGKYAGCTRAVRGLYAGSTSLVVARACILVHVSAVLLVQLDP